MRKRFEDLGKSTALTSNGFFMLSLMSEIDNEMRRDEP